MEIKCTEDEAYIEQKYRCCSFERIDNGYIFVNMYNRIIGTMISVR